MISISSFTFLTRKFNFFLYTKEQKTEIYLIKKAEQIRLLI